jgi:hypothetical protein
MEKDTTAQGFNLNSIQPYEVSDIESGTDAKLAHEPGFRGWLRSMLLSVETSGIERVTDEERKQNTTKVWHACTFWYVKTR